MTTGIGSLPHKDVQAALGLVFKYCPQIPFWPQLPKRHIREGMIGQFSQNLPCVEMLSDGVVFNPQDKERKLEVFYEHIISEDTDYFKITEDFAQGLYGFRQRLEGSPLKDIEFLKCHITGPFTFAASINDEKGRALLHDKVFMQAFLKALSMKALWQLDFLKKFGKKMVVFIDEPYLGCFGSAYTPINREDVVRGLAELTESIKARKALTGVHCCGNTDWSIFTEIKTLDIINFDAFGFLDRLVLYADSLKGFFARGGMLCWGIVPTQEFKGESPDLLYKRISEGVKILVNKGLDNGQLLKDLLLSPACGLGTLDETKAEAIFKTLSEISSKIN